MVFSDQCETSDGRRDIGGSVFLFNLLIIFKNDILVHLMARIRRSFSMVFYSTGYYLMKV